MALQDDAPRPYIIPTNFNDDDQLLGTTLGINKRNVVETIIVDIFIWLIIGVLPFIPLVLLIIRLVLILIISTVFVVGIKGESILQFTIAVIRAKKRRRQLHLRRVGYIERSKRQIIERDKKLEELETIKKERREAKLREREEREEAKLLAKEQRRTKKLEKAEQRRIEKEERKRIQS